MDGEGGYQEDKGPTKYSYSDLFHISAFRNLWLGDICSQTSDRMAFVAITVLAYGTTTSTLGLSLIMGAYFLPALVVSIPGGVAADRYSRRTLMVAAEGTRVLIALLMAFLNAGLWLLPLVLVFSSLTYLFYPSRQASIPNLVPDGALMPANAAISANLILGFAIGPLIAGLMLTTWDAQWTLVTAAVIMAVGVAIIASITVEALRTPVRDRGESKWHGLREGLAAIRSRAVLWQGFALVVFVMLAVGAGAVGLVYFGDENLGMGKEGFTVLLSALAVGTLVGAVTIGRMASRLPKGRLLIIAAELAGLMLALLSMTDQVYIALGIMFLIGVAAALVLVPFTTMLQEYLGDQVMGTGFGLLSMGLTAPLLIGIAIAAPVIESHDVLYLFWMMGLMLILVGMVTIVLSRLWRGEPVESSE